MDAYNTPNTAALYHFFCCSNNCDQSKHHMVRIMWRNYVWPWKTMQNVKIVWLL